MSKPKVVLLARINDGDRYPFVSVEIHKGRPVPIDGVVVGYYLRFTANGKRITRPIGKNLDAAFVTYQNEELQQTRRLMGLSSIDTAINRTKISDAVRQYSEDLRVSVQIGDKSKRTYKSYVAILDYFQEHCGVTYLDEITGAVLRSYKIHLFDHIKKRPYGKTSNTVAARFRCLSAFFSRYGIKISRGRNVSSDDKGLMEAPDFPRESREQNIDKYSEDEIKALLSMASVDEADLIQTFLRTGARDQEVAHLKYSDLDFRRKQIIISEKPEYGWRPKGKRSRTIPLEDGVLLKRMAERKKRYPKNALIFPNSLGGPESHLIKRLHAVVKKARDKGFEFEGRIALHKFRRTYASMMISHSDLQTVSALLGHQDIQTTARYLAPDMQKARRGSETAFRGLE
jgi:integrase